MDGVIINVGWIIYEMNDDLRVILLIVFGSGAKNCEYNVTYNLGWVEKNNNKKFHMKGFCVS